MKKFSPLLFLFIFLCSELFGGVNLKNGNFYISYEDHDLNSTSALFGNVVRTYNSKSIYRGIFGFGWGSEIETHLSGYPDGSMVIKEHGAGGKTYFDLGVNSGELTDLMIDQLIDAMIAEGELENIPSAITRERNNFKNSIEKRSNKWDKYVEKGVLTHYYDFPEGTKWESYLRGNETLTLENGTFIRLRNDNDHYFDSEGRLIRMEGKNDFFAEISYKMGHLSHLRNSDGSEFFFEVNSEGLVTKIDSKNDSFTGSSSYEYDGPDLIKTRDAGGNVYNYQYDEAHNLIAIDYSDGSNYRVEYHPGTLYVKSVTERSGEKTEYDYKVFYREDGTEDKDHYATSVTKNDLYGNRIENYYEYQIGIKPSGERYNQMVKTVINGTSTTTYYDGLCPGPEKIIRNEHTTTFLYNNRCLLISKKSTRGMNISMEYHPEMDKITKVENEGVTTDFEYNSNGDVIVAERNDGLRVDLVYDENGKIKSMTQNDSHLEFEYNNMGKPVMISIEGVGVLNVEYDSGGDITRVASPEGQAVSMQITQAFQQLLSVIKPPNVDYNPW